MSTIASEILDTSHATMVESAGHGGRGTRGETPRFSAPAALGDVGGGAEFSSHFSANLAGGPLGESPQGERSAGSATTTLDLAKPSDVNTVHRAVCNGWDVPQHIREQISEQVCPALDAAKARMEDPAATDKGRNRATMQLIKLVRLVALMDARNRVDDGERGIKAIFPALRKRSPEKRRPRRSFIDVNEANVAQLAEALRKLHAVRGGATTPPTMSDSTTPTENER